VFGRCAATARAAAVDLVARALPHLRDDVETLAAALARREPRSESCGSLHGDVHPKNALVEHGAVGLIDVEEMAWGPRAADLASLLARLVCARLLGLETPDRIRAAADALLDGYSAVAPLPAASDLRWHLAATMLVERAQRAVTRLNDAALQRLDLIVAQGMRALDGEGDVS
jgi:Ser/Thr protein kinase RdoA (MazF antagonist)